MRSRLRRNAVCLVAGLAYGWALPVPAQGESLARPLPQWDAVFRGADPAWRGADANYSVPLGESRTLWLFGDTWITAPDATSRAGSTMARNTLAIQATVGDAPALPRMYWDARSPEPRGQFAPSSGEGWLWPLSGQYHDGRLYLFMSRLVHSDEGLGFASYGNILVTVTNPDQAPPNWTNEETPIPYFKKGEHGDRVFGCASVAAPDNEHVYIYGYQENWDEGFGARRLRIARTSWDALRAADLSAWEFWDGNAWTAKVEAAATLFDESASEMSVHYDATRKKYIAVYTRFGWSEEILLRHAPAPEGPWSDAVVVYVCPDVQRDEDYFCYAAKAHPELPGKPNELIVTYATNSREFSDHVTDPDLYWPQFIAIDLDRVPGL